MTDCSDEADGDYCEKVAEIIAAEGKNALDCCGADYYQIYYELYGFGLIGPDELEEARKKYL